MRYYTDNPPLDEERRTEAYENRKSIGVCFYCGEPIYADDDSYYGDDYIDCEDGIIHFENCWEKYGKEKVKRA